jgi:type IV pilus assembly protein PilA
METTMSARLLRIAREALAKRAGAAEQEGAEDGFTLIELMVVLLIMAILLAIAIPTFLGVKGGAQDRAAQSNLTNALISAKSSYATNGSYCASTTCGTAAANATALILVLNSQEPELSFTNGAVAAGNTNSLSMAVTADGQQTVLVDQSASKTCWAVSDNDGDAPTTAALGQAGLGTKYAEWTAANCNAGSLVAGTALTNTPGWQSQFPTVAPTAGP